MKQLTAEGREASPDPAKAAFSESAWYGRRAADRTSNVKLTESERAMAGRLERLIAGGSFAIPQVPSIAIEAMGLLARSDTGAGDIADVVARDQRLAADVLSFANSAAFTSASGATNLQQALMRVGFRRTRSLVLAACLKGAMYSGSDVRRAERLWRHSCATAAAAAKIASNLGFNSDDHYVAGLFHDVGKLVVLSSLDQLGLRSVGTAVGAQAVEHLVQTHHERVGAEVAMHWGLPDDVVDAVQRHEHGDDGFLTPAQAVVMIADHCCVRLGVGSTETDHDDGRPVACVAALRALRAAPEDVPRILEGVRETIEMMQARNA